MFVVILHSTLCVLFCISRVKTSIVGIGVYNPLSAPRYQLLGTGFAVQSTSSNITYIATNHHVVNGPSYSPDKAEISVHVGEGKNAKFYRAKLIKQDERSDVAIISIEAELPTLNLANDNQTVRAGTDILIAGLPIGSVLGLYKSVHRGMVAAYVPMAIPQNNSSQLSIELIRQLRNPLFVYQLDATAYPGNSGSPIVNSHTGEVIAILNSVLVKKTKEHLLSDPSGISYAIPAQYIRALLP
jgi:serine protease Do